MRPGTIPRTERTLQLLFARGWGHSRYVDTSADAAVAGSITIGSSDLLSGSTCSYATLYTANSGSVTLYRW